MIKIILVEYERLVRQGLTFLLQTCSDLQIIGEAENGIEAIQKVQILNPDLLIMDINLPKMDGLATTKIITKKFPHTKIIILSSFACQDDIDEAIKLKISGYLSKNISLEDF
jgi:YesN/AraC family two-component response regulator